MPTTPTSGVYAITNVVTGDRYIGSSEHVTVRFRKHKEQLRRGCHENIHLQRAWNKYGDTVFAFALIEEVSHTDDLLAREQHYIVSTNHRYNICPKAGRPPNMAGIPKSASHRAKIAAAKKGKAKTEETKRRMSEAQRQRAAEGRMPRKTPEQRARQSAYRKQHPEITKAMVACVSNANRRREWSVASRQKLGESLRKFWRGMSAAERRQRVRSYREAS